MNGSPVPERFEREQGCTEAEWLRWLPAAVHGHALERTAARRACVSVGAGTLQVDWEVLEPRRIALVQMPRLRVSYVFDGVEEGERRAFMRRFDLHMQRGGG